VPEFHWHTLSPPGGQRLRVQPVGRAGSLGATNGLPPGRTRPASIERVRELTVQELATRRRSRSAEDTRPSIQVGGGPIAPAKDIGVKI